MEKLNDILLLIVGIVYGLMAYSPSITDGWGTYVIALAFIIIGGKGLMNK